jgi:hypothetical protein
MSLVRSNRSNPALKRVWQKQGFCKKYFVDCGIKSAAVYAAKATKAQRIFFAKPGQVPPCILRHADLAFVKACQEICDR